MNLVSVPRAVAKKTRVSGSKLDLNFNVTPSLVRQLQEDEEAEAISSFILRGTDRKSRKGTPLVILEIPVW